MAEQLTDGSPAGAVMGRSDDKIAFYGATPIVKQTVTLVATAATTSTATATLQALQNALADLGIIATS